jgi:hypothetical protein
MELLVAYSHAKQSSPESGVRPVLTSYDSGYEHSLEHWVELQRLVEEADREASPEQGTRLFIAPKSGILYWSQGSFG